MRVTLRLSLVALAATAVLAAAVGASFANNLSVSNQNFRVTWHPLEFREPGSLAVRCDITMEGSFHSATIPKVARSLIGYVTRALVNQNTCRTNLGTAAHAIPWNGSEVILGATINQSLPWHVTYENFEGVLPNITGIGLLLSGVRFTLEVPGTSCLASYGRAETNLTGTVSVTTREADRLIPGSVRAPRQELIRGTCPPEGSFVGNGVLTVLGATTRIRVTLI
jgi:hypothetical protein